jgi:hypothetical protein
MFTSASGKGRAFAKADKDKGDKVLRICSNHESCQRTFKREFCPHKVPHSVCKGICPETQEPVVCETWDEIEKRYAAGLPPEKPESLIDDKAALK